MRREISSRLSTSWQSSQTIRKCDWFILSVWLKVINWNAFFYLLLFREWDRFAKGEYERLAMEEEGGDDSEMIDAMDGWDSEDDSTATQGEGST